MQIKVMRQILEWNEDVSSKVRSILQEKNIYMVNVMGSPGAGRGGNDRHRSCGLCP